MRKVIIAFTSNSIVEERFSLKNYVLLAELLKSHVDFALTKKNEIFCSVEFKSSFFLI